MTAMIDNSSSEDPWEFLDGMSKLERRAFIRKAIDDKLRRDCSPEELRELGYPLDDE